MAWPQPAIANTPAATVRLLSLDMSCVLSAARCIPAPFRRPMRRPAADAPKLKCRASGGLHDRAPPIWGADASGRCRRQEGGLVFDVDTHGPERSAAWRYGFAISAVALATALTWVSQFAGLRHPSTAFLAAIV